PEIMQLRYIHSVAAAQRRILNKGVLNMKSLKEKRLLKERERTPRMVLQDLLDDADKIDEIAVTISTDKGMVETHISTSDTIMIVGMLEAAKKDVLKLSEVE